jgi:hypothetical protein
MYFLYYFVSAFMHTPDDGTPQRNIALNSQIISSFFFLRAKHFVARSKLAFVSLIVFLPANASFPAGFPMKQFHHIRLVGCEETHQEEGTW